MSFKIQQLKDQCHSLTPLHREVKLNSIDKITTDLLMNVEKKSRKIRTGEVNYSPETAKAGKTWYFGKLLLEHKLCERNSFGGLLSLSDELDIEDLYTMFVENI